MKLISYISRGKCMQGTCVVVAILTLGMVAIAGCGKRPRSEGHREDVMSDFSGIRSKLRLGTTPELAFKEPLEAILACPLNRSRSSVSVIAVDQVIDKKRRQLLALDHPDYPVSEAHREQVGRKVSAAELLAKVGSSYSTWCLTFDGWRLALMGARIFSWTNVNDGASVSEKFFPMVWEERGRVSKERVIILADSYLLVQDVTNKRFEHLMEDARAWLEQGGCSEGEVTRFLASENDEEIAKGILALGTKGEVSSIGRVGPFLESGSFRVRWSSIWALGAIGDSKGIPMLAIVSDEGIARVPSGIRASDASKFINEAIVKSLATIGGKRAVKPLMALWEDRKEESLGNLIKWALGRIGTDNAREALNSLNKEN